MRLIHKPTGIVVTSTAERSQHMNKKEAMKKLQAILNEKEQKVIDDQNKTSWQEHNQIVRGNPTRIYEGTSFRLRK